MFCDFCEIDHFALVPLNFGERFDPSDAPSPYAVKSDPLKPFNNISEPLNLAFEAMTSGAFEPCSNIPELLNLAIEVTFITRQMLFGHRTPLAAPGRVTRQPKVRSGFSALAAPSVGYSKSSHRGEQPTNTCTRALTLTTNLPAP
jgi:hypothetical protein